MREFREFGDLVENVDEVVSINVAIQSRNKKQPFSPEGFLNWRFPIEEMDRVVRDIDCSYSPCHYNNGYRLDDNATVGTMNSLMLDFDDGLSIEEAKALFSEYDGLIATTKSHQKDKNGIICDRFRVIIPTDTPVTLNATEYKDLMVQIMNVYEEADKACKNISRFYFGYEGSEVIRLQGDKLFNWKYYYNLHLSKEEKRRRVANIESSFSGKRVATLEFAETKADYIRQIAMTDKLLEIVKFDRFGVGGRNNYLYSVAMYLRESGLSDDEVRELVLWVNSRGDGLKENEIESTIFRSMRMAV